MKKHPIATVVNFCTNESRFIKATLEEADRFSSQIIVPVCDHFFDGKAENKSLLDQIYRAFPNVLFVEFPFIPQKIPKKIWKKIKQANFWHSLSRFIGLQYLKENIDSVLFIDADEVPDGKVFSSWLKDSDYQQYSVMKLACFWYFREAKNQALKYEETPVLAQKKALNREIVLHQDERDAIYNLLPGPKRRYVLCPGGAPMFHHYSWVRTKEEMIKKVTSWGHKNDRDWVSLVHEEFSSPFKGVDFVHGYQYKSVQPQFDITLLDPSFQPKGEPNLIRLSEQELLDIIGIRNFWNFFRFL